MKVQIDYTRCTTSGNCMMVAPQVFEVRADGTYVINEEPDWRLRARVLEAVRGCPTQAIFVEGDEE